MGEVILKRSIVTPRKNIIPEGTVLCLEEDGSTKFNDETLFLYRFHRLCYELDEYDEGTYFPDYDVNPQDEMLREGGDAIFDMALGEQIISEIAFDEFEGMNLAEKFNPKMWWGWLWINWESLAIITQDRNECDKKYFLLGKYGNFTFNLRTYGLSLQENELVEGNIGDTLTLYNGNCIRSAKLLAFGRGIDWINQQMSNNAVGRNGEPVKLGIALNTDKLHVLCEVEDGQLMIIPYGREYGVEDFAHGIFKNQLPNENYSNFEELDRRIIRSCIRLAISYEDSLKLVDIIANTKIEDCKVAVIEDSNGKKQYVTGTGFYAFEPLLRYIPSIEECVFNKNIEYIRMILDLEGELKENKLFIKFESVLEAYYNSMRVNPVIRMSEDNLTNKSLGFKPEHIIVCAGKNAYGFLHDESSSPVGYRGCEMIIDNVAKISDIDFSGMEFTQFTYDMLNDNANSIVEFEDMFEESDDIVIEFEEDEYEVCDIPETEFLKIKPLNQSLIHL